MISVSGLLSRLTVSELKCVSGVPWFAVCLLTSWESQWVVVGPWTSHCSPPAFSSNNPRKCQLEDSLLDTE